jgi:pimeloyl-ACP methyl ester carboxylesterase
MNALRRRAPVAIVGATMLLLSFHGFAVAAPDAACGFCVHDGIQHRFRIENHPCFHAEQVLQDRCAAVEFPVPIFKVAADGTQSSIFDVTQVIEGSCQTTLTDPVPHFLDDNFQPIDNPDFDTFGAAFPIDRRPSYVRFQYTHPRTPPDAGDKFRVIRIGIFYTDRRDPEGPEQLSTVLEIHVYRPPVVMIHGLWSDSSAFATMEQALSSSNYEPFQLYRLDYRYTNDSSFAVNYPRVADGIDAVIQQSADADLAAGKVDLVAHSMGGVLSRLYTQNPGYENEVRRIITCNTPHAGSQMANLLLDRAFDPHGLICSLLGRAMSSDTVPDRGCYNGAVGDFQVNSFANMNLNLGVPPDDIEVHALATVFDLTDLPNLSGLFNAAGAAPAIIAHLLQACGISLVDSIFNSDDNDLIVAATSQAGGLAGPLTSLYPDQPHMGSVANTDVIDGVRDLLNEPLDSDKFTRSGYDPSVLRYTTPSVCPVLGGGSGLGHSLRNAAAVSTFGITSPVSGTSVPPGATLAVDAGGDPDVATVVLVLSQPGGQMMVVEHPGPAAHFDLQVPDTALGQQNLVAAGLDAAGSLLAISDAVVVNVAVPAVLQSISVYPPVVYLRPCSSASLEITGHYDDGVARDLSAQGGLRFSFAAGSAVRTGSGDVVLNEALDDTLTITLDGIDSAPVPIRALPNDGAGPCVASTSTTTSTSSTTTATSPASTTTSSTTTSTTVVDTTTTTTTLAPQCQQSGDCDDGDACTDDTCSAGACQHLPIPGASGASCLLGRLVSGPLCPAGTIDPALEHFATEKLRGALEQVQKAEQATTSKKQRRLLGNAAKRLGRIEKHRSGTTTADCLASLSARVDGVLAAIDDLRPR